MRKIVKLFLLIQLLLSISACRNHETLETTIPGDPTISLQAIHQPNNTPAEEINQNLIFINEVINTNAWLEISIEPLNEDIYIKDLDFQLMETIAIKIQALVIELNEKEKADPEYVLQGKWNEDFRSSEQYTFVLDMGLRAIKPVYYIIYKSEFQGLYEYILASAIDDIIGYDFYITEDYQWSTSKQFLSMYNEKVSRTLIQFEEINEDSKLNSEQKLERISHLGIFAVAPLLNMIDETTSHDLTENFKLFLNEIIKDYSGEDIEGSLDEWRLKNEQNFRDIIQILPLLS